MIAIGKLGLPQRKKFLPMIITTHLHTKIQYDSDNLLLVCWLELWGLPQTLQKQRETIL